MRARTALFLFPALFLSPGAGHAQSAKPSLWPATPSFFATCDAGETRRYDKFYDLEGKLMWDEEWSENDQFLGVKGAWEVFHYSSGNDYVSLLKTGTKARVIARYPMMMIVIDPYEAVGAIGAWAYSINLHIPDMVAIEIKSEGTPDTRVDRTLAGLNGHIVALDCNFEFSSVDD